MAGGFIVPQERGDHQKVEFIFVGAWTQADVDEWNDAILALKQSFPAMLIGITVKGEHTPKSKWVSVFDKPKKKAKPPKKTPKR
jgi:hypothetical protein